MIMIDQSKRLSEPLRWTRAGRLAVVVAAVCLALAVVGVGVYALVGPRHGGAREGCIEVIFASTLGGANLYACGHRAKEVCASPASNPGAAASTLREACRRAGYAYGAQRAGDSQRVAG